MGKRTAAQRDILNAFMLLFDEFILVDSASPQPGTGGEPPAPKKATPPAKPSSDEG